MREKLGAIFGQDNRYHRQGLRQGWKRLTVQATTPKRHRMKAMHAPIRDAIKRRLHRWRAGMALVESGENEIGLLFLEHQMINALQHPTPQPLTPIVRRHGKHRGVIGAERLLSTVEDTLQSEFETNGLSGVGAHHNADPGCVSHQTAQKSLGEMRAHMVDVIRVPRLGNQREYSRKIEIIDRRDLGQRGDTEGVGRLAAGLAPLGEG